MSQNENDISWQVLRRIVQDWAGSAVDLAQVQPLAGGAISQTLALTTSEGRQAVLKISPHRVDRAYEHEAHQLNTLRQFGLPVPGVLAWKIGTLEDPFSYLLLEFVSGVDLAVARRQADGEAFERLQADLAAQVLSLHQQVGTQYGRLTAQPGPQFANWPEFYRDMYDSILQETLRSPLLPVKCRKTLAKVHERLDRLLAHDDVPRLVHWDLWSGNLLAAADESGCWKLCAVLDPNCKYAHAEAEIAYLELFHTVTPTFLRAYQQQRKLSPEYHRLRKPIYQLYPLINHVNLFGQEYLNPLLAATEKAAALV